MWGGTGCERERSIWRENGGVGGGTGCERERRAASQLRPVNVVESCSGEPGGHFVGCDGDRRVLHVAASCH